MSLTVSVRRWYEYCLAGALSKPKLSPNLMYVMSGLWARDWGIFFINQLCIVMPSFLWLIALKLWTISYFIRQRIVIKATQYIELSTPISKYLQELGNWSWQSSNEIIWNHSLHVCRPIDPLHSPKVKLVSAERRRLRLIPSRTRRVGMRWDITALVIQKESHWCSHIGKRVSAHNYVIQARNKFNHKQCFGTWGIIQSSRIRWR